MSSPYLLRMDNSQTVNPVVVKDLQWGKNNTGYALAADYPPGAINLYGCYQWPTKLWFEGIPYSLRPRDTSTSALYETPPTTWKSLPPATIVSIFFDSRFASTVSVSRLPDVNHPYTWQDTVDLDPSSLNSWPERI